MVAVSFGLTLFVLQRFSGPVDDCTSGEPVVLKPPFASGGGKAFVARTEVAGDSNDLPWRSSLVMCEDQKKLGPSHSPHEDIRSRGGGRYSHWGSDVVFSASDNSDPNTNRRQYSYVPIGHQR